MKTQNVSFIITLLLLILNAPISFAQANDNCVNAITLTVDAACTNGTNVGSTLEAGENAGATGAGCWMTAPSNTVWYKFTTGVAGNYTVSTDNGGSTDTQLKILSGTCGAFTSVGCNDDGGTTNAFAAVASANLAASTTYFVQVDVYGGTTANFCINVTYNPPIPNDCIFDAIDLTSLINGVSIPLAPFNCRPSDLYCSASSIPTRQDLSGDPNGCEVCDLTCTAKNPDHRDIWYKFTVSASTPPVWLTVFNEQPDPNPPTFATAIYSGTPTGVCGTGLIGGMTQIDCSAGDILPICIAPCEDGGGYGARNKAICTTPTRPRINIAGLPNGTYYFRIWDWGGGTPDQGRLVICAESSITNPPTQDKCPTTNTIGCADGPPANATFDSVYSNLSNAGMTGNSCNTDPNEPQVATGPSTDFIANATCLGGYGTGVGYINNVMNNSAIYRFEVNALAPCVARPEITLSNISYGGRTGNAIQVQVMNSPCTGGTNAIMAWSTNTSCLKMRMASNGTIPNGIYYIVVDGQDGQLIKYDLRLQLSYTGAGCTALATNVCDVALPIELVEFSVDSVNYNQALVRWTTASEINNRAFTLEKSKNAIDFEEVTIVEGAGNSNANISYSYVDAHPFEGISYYRLKQTDYDGKFVYSQLATFVKPAETDFMNLYPNPAHETITVPLSGLLPDLHIDVINTMGHHFYSVDVREKKESVEIDVSELSVGLYMIKVQLNNGDVKIAKFFKE